MLLCFSNRLMLRQPAHVYPLRQRTRLALRCQMLWTRQGLGAGVGRDEDGLG